MSTNDASIDAISRGMRRPTWTIILSIGLVALATFLFLRGYDFYQLSVGNRPLHDDYRVLSPTGLVGQGYGVFGTALIVLNLLYLIRRRMPRMKLGSLRVWLEFHVFTGLAGSMLILFHSAFQIRNNLALATSVSLLLVVLSGVIGRYMVGLAPRANPERLKERLEALDLLVPGVSSRVRRALDDAPFTQFATSRGLMVTLATVPRWMREARARASTVQKVMASYTEHLDDVDAAIGKRVAKEAARAARDEVRAEAATSVLRVWRRIHRFFAILMLMLVSVHIGVAWYYGYRWIFSADGA